MRRRILKRDEYLCVQCFKAGKLSLAKDVDHKVRKADGGTDDQESNLQSLCRPCHKAKTAAEGGR